MRYSATKIVLQNLLFE